MKKIKTPKGNFDLNLTQNQIDKINLYKRIFIAVSFILLLLPVFIKQQALLELNKNRTFIVIYAFSLILLIIGVIFLFVTSFLGLKIRNIIPFVDFPKNIKTHYSTYYFIILALINSGCQIGMTVWKFSISSLILSITSVLVFVISIFYYKITVFAYKKAEYLSPTGKRIKMSDDVEIGKLDDADKKEDITPPPIKTNLPLIHNEQTDELLNNKEKENVDNSTSDDNDFYN